MKALSVGEETLDLHLRTAKIPFQREAAVIPGRKFRFDFELNDRILIEIQGGTWNNGGHVRGKQFQSDCDKFNAATKAGYRCLKFTTEDVTSGKALQFIEGMI